MKLLTTKQWLWLLHRKVKIGSFYMFPSFDFRIYSKPEYSSGENFPSSPFGKHLYCQYFVIKEIVNGYYRVNFYDRPKGPDFYLDESTVLGRPLSATLFLILITFIPMALYNLFNGGVESDVDKMNKIDNKISEINDAITKNDNKISKINDEIDAHYRNLLTKLGRAPEKEDFEVYDRDPSYRKFDGNRRYNHEMYVTALKIYKEIKSS